ncbi:MAG: hypothetical protein K2Q06_05475 [Parvularculaceae bacterium]|nr:hypothetical protein [Parvularculaceae bacterium]
MSPKTAALLLRVNAAISMIAFGLVWALAAFGVEAPVRLALDVLKWPVDGDPGSFSAEARWFSALGGAFLVAFGLLIYGLVAPGVARGDREARRWGLVSLFVWFVIDSLGSIAAGAPSNAVFNVVFLVLFAGPMLAVRRAP